MKKFLYLLIFAFAIWMVMSPFILGVSDWLRRGIDLGLGMIVAILTFVGVRALNIKYPAWTIFFIGLVMIVWGGIVRPITGGPGGGNEILIGIMWVLLSLVITQLFVFTKISAY